MIEDDFLAPCDYCITAIKDEFNGEDSVKALCKVHRALLFVNTWLLEKRRREPQNGFVKKKMFSLPIGRQVATWKQIEQRVVNRWSCGRELFW